MSDGHRSVARGHADERVSVLGGLASGVGAISIPGETRPWLGEPLADRRAIGARPSKLLAQHGELHVPSLAPRHISLRSAPLSPRHRHDLEKTRPQVA